MNQYQRSKWAEAVRARLHEILLTEGRPLSAKDLLARAQSDFPELVLNGMCSMLGQNCEGVFKKVADGWAVTSNRLPRFLTLQREIAAEENSSRFFQMQAAAGAIIGMRK